MARRSLRKKPEEEKSLWDLANDYVKENRKKKTVLDKSESEDLKAEKPTGSFKCNICNKVFTYKEYLKRHKRIHNPENPFSCHLCDHTCKAQQYLRRHLQVKHGQGSKKHECDVCGKKFYYRGKLDSHYRVHTREKPFKCDVCGKDFSAQYSLNTHKFIHTSEKPFHCSFCDYACRDNSTLRKHQARHMGLQKIYQCKLCDKQLKSKSYLKIHVAEKHLGADVHKFPCEHCHKKFKDKSGLSVHVRVVHLKNIPKPHSCDVCGNKYRTLDCLKRHLIAHLDFRPFTCDFKGCGMKFKEKRTLSLHENIHYPERCVPCEECGKLFTKKSRLNAHIRKGHRGNNRTRYYCDLCGFSTLNKASLIMHLRSHENKTKLKCKECNKEYKSGAYLQLHYLNSHGMRFKTKELEKVDAPLLYIKEEPLDLEVDVKIEPQDEGTMSDDLEEPLVYSDTINADDLANILEANDSLISREQIAKIIGFENIDEVSKKSLDSASNGDEDKNYVDFEDTHESLSGTEDFINRDQKNNKLKNDFDVKDDKLDNDKVVKTTDVNSSKEGKDEKYDLYKVENTIEPKTDDDDEFEDVIEKPRRGKRRIRSLKSVTKKRKMSFLQQTNKAIRQGKDVSFGAKIVENDEKIELDRRTSKVFDESKKKGVVTEALTKIIMKRNATIGKELVKEVVRNNSKQLRYVPDELFDDFFINRLTNGVLKEKKVQAPDNQVDLEVAAKVVESIHTMLEKCKRKTFVDKDSKKTDNETDKIPIKITEECVEDNVPAKEDKTNEDTKELNKTERTEEVPLKIAEECIEDNVEKKTNENEIKSDDTKEEKLITNDDDEEHEMSETDDEDTVLRYDDFDDDELDETFTSEDVEINKDEGDVKEVSTSVVKDPNDEVEELERVRLKYNELIKKALKKDKRKDNTIIKYFQRKPKATMQSPSNSNTEDTLYTNRPNEANSREDYSGSSREKNGGKLKLNTEQCYVCFKLFANKKELLEHCEEHFDICSEKSLKKCPFCAFVTDKSLQKHIQSKHNIKEDWLFGRIKTKNDENGTKFCYQVDGNLVKELEIIPSVKNLNKMAYQDIDKKRREEKQSTLARTKLVKKGNEWIVENEELKVYECFLPEFTKEELLKAKVKTYGETYPDKLKKLYAIAKKKGLPMLFPCDSCDKVCQKLSALKLHSRKHNTNAVPFKKKVWKHKSHPVPVSPSVAKSVSINRFARPKPVVNRHKCDPKLIDFYENNVKGGDIEFWQFLKIYNRMSKDNIDDFDVLDKHTEFGYHRHFTNDDGEESRVGDASGSQSSGSEFVKDAVVCIPD